MESPEKMGEENLSNEPTRRLEKSSLETHALAVTIERVQAELRRLEDINIKMPIDWLNEQNSKQLGERHEQLEKQEQSLLKELKGIKPDHLGIPKFEEEIAMRDARIKIAALESKLRETESSLVNLKAKVRLGMERAGSDEEERLHELAAKLKKDIAQAETELK